MGQTVNFNLFVKSHMFHFAFCSTNGSFSHLICSFHHTYSKRHNFSNLTMRPSHRAHYMFTPFVHNKRRFSQLNLNACVITIYTKIYCDHIKH